MNPDGVDEQVVEALAEVERESFRLAHDENDPAAGLAVIDRFLAGELGSDVRSEALAFRAIVLEMQERLGEAKASLLDAHRLAAGATFHRYGIEVGLLQICEKLQDVDGARAWGRAALASAGADPSIDGSGVVQSLLSIAGGQEALTDAEVAQCRAVLQDARRTRGLPEAHDLSDLARLSDELA